MFNPKNNTWLVSDTHFNHSNILKFKDQDNNLIRPFSSVQEMNQLMIDNWNSVVKQGDTVIHLGDVFFGDKEVFKSLWPKLNGKKRLIIGNHDDPKFLCSGGFFSKSSIWKKIPEKNLILSHIPLHSGSLYNKSGELMLNVHGHIHQNNPPKGNYVNLSVEMIDYTPVHIDQVYDLHKEQQKITD